MRLCAQKPMGTFTEKNCKAIITGLVEKSSLSPETLHQSWVLGLGLAKDKKIATTKV